MRTREEHDDQTIAIAIALGWGVLTLIVVGLIAWALDSVSSVIDDHGQSLSPIALILFVAVMVISLVRSRR